MRKGFCITCLIVILGSVVYAQDEHGVKQQASPHAVALMLVLEEKNDEIAKLDDAKLGKEDNMLDVKERSWTVIRPLAPGFIDSTHLFTVNYRIDNQVIKSWNVDTGNRTVRESPEVLK